MHLVSPFFLLIIISHRIDVSSVSTLSSLKPSNTLLINSSLSLNTTTKQLRRSTFPYVKIDPAQRRYKRIHKDRDSKLPDLENVFHREEDVLLCLQLLAYLSKYPHIRDIFHNSYSRNVFSVVEKFCHRLHPGPIQYWAGVIMRNACRKDETQGGIRRCANMSCGKWETQPREFAKCRRCRKAKYCSKACQSKAWADGHRWWCVERHSSIVRDSTSLPETNITTTPITTPITTTTTTTTTDTSVSTPLPIVSENDTTNDNNNTTMLMEMGMQL
jgi:hypothetical protein